MDPITLMVLAGCGIAAYFILKNRPVESVTIEQKASDFDKGVGAVLDLTGKILDFFSSDIFEQDTWDKITEFFGGEGYSTQKGHAKFLGHLFRASQQGRLLGLSTNKDTYGAINEYLNYEKRKKLFFMLNYQVMLKNRDKDYANFYLYQKSMHLKCSDSATQKKLLIGPETIPSDLRSNFPLRYLQYVPRTDTNSTDVSKALVGFYSNGYAGNFAQCHITKKEKADIDVGDRNNPVRDRNIYYYPTSAFDAQMPEIRLVSFTPKIFPWILTDNNKNPETTNVFDSKYRPTYYPPVDSFDLIDGFTYNDFKSDPLIAKWVGSSYLDNKKVHVRLNTTIPRFTHVWGRFLLTTDVQMGSTKFYDYTSIMKQYGGYLTPNKGVNADPPGIVEVAIGGMDFVLDQLSDTSYLEILKAIFFADFQKIFVGWLAAAQAKNGNFFAED